MSAAQPERSRARMRAAPSEDPMELADLVACAGLALAAQDAGAVAAVRVQVEALHRASPDVAQLAELLTVYEHAQRVRAERQRQVDAHRPLRESLLLELINLGPLAPSELVAAVGGERHHIVDAPHKLESDGLVDASAPPTGGRRPRRRYEATNTGVAAAMGG